MCVCFFLRKVYVCLIFKKADTVYKIMFYLMREKKSILYTVAFLFSSMFLLYGQDPRVKREKKEKVCHIKWDPQI